MAGAALFPRFLRSKTLDSSHWRIYRPTTGALLLLTALQLCDQVRLCLGAGELCAVPGPAPQGTAAGAGEGWVCQSTHVSPCTSGSQRPDPREGTRMKGPPSNTQPLRTSLGGSNFRPHFSSNLHAGERLWLHHRGPRALF